MKMESRSKPSDPPETDLEYYARPENYTGSNLNSLTKFLVAKESQKTKKKKVSKEKGKHSDEKKLFRRYRHILSPELHKSLSSISSLSSSSPSSSSSESDDELTRTQRTECWHEQKKRQRNTKPQKGVVFKDHGRNTDDSPEPLDEMKSNQILSNKDRLPPLNPPVSRNKDDDACSSVKDSTHIDKDKTFSDCSVDSGIRGSETDVLSRQSYDDNGSHNGSEISQAWQPNKTKEAESEVKNSRSPSLPGSRTSVTSLYTPRKKGSLAKMLSVRNKLTVLSKNARRKVQSERFRRITVGIVNVLKLAKAIIKPTDSPSALLNSFTVLSQEAEEKPDIQSENMKSYGLHFDPSYYKANKEISVSNEVKSTLSLPPGLRTPEQIQTAMFGLQSLPSFAEYPLHMQEKLTKVAWFETVTPMRTIIRQGHFAENFYFILSGKALVTLNKPGEAVPKTAGMMRKGTSFGELALLHHSRRTATVTSHDTVQLLSIGREDFFDIFMSGHGTGDMPEHIKFVSQLEFMKDWPLERLLERPDQCLLHFFKRNTVILRDSKSSDWFYIVKSGTCQVLKELRGVTGRGVVERHQPKIKDCLFDDTGTKSTKLSRLKQLSRDPMAWSNENGSKSVNGKVSRNDDQLTARSFSRLRYHDKLSTGKPHFIRKDRIQEKEQTHTPRENSPVFVHVEILKPKDVFGLDLINFHGTMESTSSSVSLVSLGAECIMLSKSFFIRHANDKVRKRLSEIVTPYPDENSMQESLQNEADWAMYKRSVLTQMAMAKPSGLRNQPLTAMTML